MQDANLTPDEPLRFIFSDVVATCEALAKDNVLNEVTLTGAVLGAMHTSTLHHPEATKALMWSIYNQGPAKDPYSEGATGMDFGLIIVHHTGLARFAAFQAKRPSNSKGTGLAVNRTRDDETLGPVSQLVTLHQAAKELAIACKKSDELENLRWVHYLHYGEELKCIPLSSLGNALDEELKKPGSSGTISIVGLGTTFDSILVAGLNTNARAWLTMGYVGQLSAIPDYFREMPLLLVADAKGLGMKPSEFWKKLSDPKSSPIAKKTF